MSQSSLQTPSVAPDAAWRGYTQRLVALYNTGQFTLQSLPVLSITIQWTTPVATSLDLGTQSFSCSSSPSLSCPSSGRLTIPQALCFLLRSRRLLLSLGGSNAIILHFIFSFKSIHGFIQICLSKTFQR